MRMIRYAVLAAGLLGSQLLQAEVRIEGPVEFGLFESRHVDPQPGERILLRSGQNIIPGAQIPARLGSKFGLRYRLSGKRAEDTPLTLLYLTPGVTTPDGQRHDKFEVTQKLLPDSEYDVMAFEFSERHEVVAGEWTFMLFQGDRKLAEQRFVVE